MNVSPDRCCILNSGSGAWAFEPLARDLSKAIGVDLSETPRDFNYILYWESEVPPPFASFIDWNAIRAASDKRLLAKLFDDHDVPRPETKLCETFSNVRQHLKANRNREWCLKYPTSCGAAGHILLTDLINEPVNWPRPFIVQEFIRLSTPEVFRTYVIGGEMFGWVVRRFPAGVTKSPWVAHARGARYEILEGAPETAARAAQHALNAAGLSDSFGCADLMQKPDGNWVVLEIGTDGVFNHVDREIGNEQFEHALKTRVADAFWSVAQRYFCQQ
ncbi:MAG: RimK family alpha-L-glutamate ligase [Limisphaerales bacterium]